jgi:hypothetical protein
LEKYDGVLWSELIWLRKEPVEGFCEHCDEHLGSVKCCDILEYVNDCWLLKEDSSMELVIGLTRDRY